MNLRKELEKKMIDADLTFKELSRQLGISELTLRNKINNNGFSIKEAVSLSNILNINENEFIELFVKLA